MYRRASEIHPSIMRMTDIIASVCAHFLVLPLSEITSRAVPMTFNMIYVITIAHGRINFEFINFDVDFAPSTVDSLLVIFLTMV